jgi:hypothetical protein
MASPAYRTAEAGSLRAARRETTPRSFASSPLPPSGTLPSSVEHGPLGCDLALDCRERCFDVTDKSPEVVLGLGDLVG